MVVVRDTQPAPVVPLEHLDKVMAAAQETAAQLITTLAVAVVLALLAQTDQQLAEMAATD